MTYKMIKKSRKILKYLISTLKLNQCYFSIDIIHPPQTEENPNANPENITMQIYKLTFDENNVFRISSTLLPKDKA